ncbi:MAG: hypothetical protein GY792_33740 [Gammaproteobacteria bacterium]|nr:hypothetical protein [Gammaproteobacteria bacterium]
MAILLFSLRNVPDDEADAIRTLLRGNDIDFFETSAGNWGISAPGIWLKETAIHEHAKALLEEFQQSWTIEQKEKFRQLAKNGEINTVFDRLKRNPIQVIIYIAIALFILYISIKPFVDFGN